MVKKMNRFKSVKFRTKLIIFFLLAILVVLLASVYNYFSLQMLIKDTTEMYEKTMELISIYRLLGYFQNEIETYLSTNSSDSLIAFYDYMNEIRGLADSLISNVVYTSEGIKSKNVGNMIINYLRHGEEAIIAKRGRDIEGYTSYYERTVKENNEIMRYIEEIMSYELIDTSDNYAVISRRIQFATKFNNFLIAGVIVFVTVMILSFSFQITKPITKLASYAKKVSAGDFDVEVHSDSHDEIGILYKAFNRMVISIKKYIDEIEEKARLEKILNEQQLNNLKMKNALREAELLALQSQINPHFIFNTINIGAKIAMLEGDMKTCTYLENAADIFRYNLKGLDSAVELREEIENVKSYIYLLQTRFGDTVNFNMEIGEDEGALNIIVPRMILQPIVENAYIHGISEMEEGGVITLKVCSDAENVYVYVIDNGKGMSQDKIDELLGGKNDQEINLSLSSKTGHTTGIGIDNVIRRLRLYFNRHDVLDIKCESGLTKVIFKLPKNRQQEEQNV